MPWPVLKANVMQSTPRLHEAVANAVLQEADFIFHNSVAFHSTNHMFDPDADR
jgi:DNA-binding FadR family transcriptional regulator